MVPSLSHTLIKQRVYLCNIICRDSLLIHGYYWYIVWNSAGVLCWFNISSFAFVYLLLFQFCRYLFYLGKIRTIQLEYTDAKESLLQAARKAPIAALGFRVQCNKWAIIVRLLLGEIPERTVFMQKGMEKALRPYFELTNVS